MSIAIATPVSAPVAAQKQDAGEDVAGKAGAAVADPAEPGAHGAAEDVDEQQCRMAGCDGIASSTYRCIREAAAAPGSARVGEGLIGRLLLLPSTWPASGRPGG
jgi:hypothetical protein